jgi:hypothetical protein
LDKWVSPIAPAAKIEAIRMAHRRVAAAQGHFDHDSPSDNAKLLQGKKNIGGDVGSASNRCRARPLDQGFKSGQRQRAAKEIALVGMATRRRQEVPLRYCFNTLSDDT